MADDRRYSLAEIKANLVTPSRLADRQGLALGTVVTWAARFPDYPVPLLPGATSAGAEIHGRQAVYWCPDIQAFLSRHPGLGQPRRVDNLQRTASQNELKAGA